MFEELIEKDMFGLIVMLMIEELCIEFGLDEGVEGLVIINVDELFKVYEKGMCVGDVIIEVS